MAIAGHILVEVSILCINILKYIVHMISSYVLGQGKFVIFGGQGFPAPNNKLGKGESSRVQTYYKREVYNDLFQFDCETCTWTPIYPNGLNSPMGRRGHSAIYINRYHHGVQSTPSPVAVAPPIGPGNTLHGHSTNSVNSTSSQSHANSVNSSLATHGVANGVKSPAQRTNRDTQTAAIDASVIPPNSLLVFGGSGIELSKYTEQIYNDVWVFCLDTNSWSRHEASKAGVDPKPVILYFTDLLVIF